MLERHETVVLAIRVDQMVALLLLTALVNMSIDVTSRRLRARMQLKTMVSAK